MKQSLFILGTVTLMASLAYFLTLPHNTPIGPGILFGLPYGFFAALLHQQLGQRSSPGRTPVKLLFLVSSALLTLAYFLWHSRIPVDDAGFIMRYLYQSDQGCWYCFNAAEGPVFGISSFSHGAFTLLLYQAGLASPARCLLISNILGFFLSSYLLMLILEKISPWKILAIPLSLALLLGAKSWVSIAATGMETPLHLAIILAALWYFTLDKAPQFWFFLALAVISKLDAAPVALVWGLVWVWQKRSLLFAQPAKILLSPLIWAGIPLLIWLAFSISYFGSPLPNSAASKLSFHQSEMQHWFPFLERYLNDSCLRIFLSAFLLLWPLQMGFQIKFPPPKRAGILPGLAFLAILGMYYFYNPDERMEWYYALPDLFLLFQVVISLAYLIERVLGERLSLLSFGAEFLLPGLALLDTAGGLNYFEKHLREAESERLFMGDYIAAHTSSADTLIAYHGLPSAQTSAFVADLTALNSKSTVKYVSRLQNAVDDLHPDAAIVQAYSFWTHPFEGRPYLVDTLFYEICQGGLPPWIFFVRDESTDPLSLNAAPFEQFSGAIQIPLGNETLLLEGSSLTWHSPPGQSLSFGAGIAREDTPQMLEISEFSYDSL
ncbi:MAG: hypothetical protein H6581_14360, partial [Bacteroidia bacterium]|nr:hypothetical protein [Bacteroidia bacterium]